MTSTALEPSQTPSRETVSRVANSDRGVFERQKAAPEVISEDRRPRFPPPEDDGFPEWMAYRAEG